jgi:hypothetical protein
VDERVESLSMVERVALYRRRAGRMMTLADSCESESLKLAYLRLAAHWQDLILDLEQRYLRCDGAAGLYSAAAEGDSPAKGPDC